MADSSIEWTDKVWNPVSGCTRASAGCDNCYAVMMTRRLSGMNHGSKKYGGLTVLNPQGKRHFSGVVRCHEDTLSIPLHWRKPRRIFVNSMSDLFHRDVPWMFINRVFGIMACCPQHTFQILTKRPDIMADYLNSDRGYFVGQTIADDLSHEFGIEWHGDNRWPLSNVHLGTSVEDQQAADERIPHLLRCPAAFRFLSLEPLIGPVDLVPHLHRYQSKCSGLRYTNPNAAGDHIVLPSIDFLIIGGESGQNARPSNLQWHYDLIRQADAVGVPVMEKQLGRRVVCGCGGDVGAWARNHGHQRAECAKCGITLPLKDPKGSDPTEWPSDLRPYHEWPLKDQTV